MKSVIAITSGIISVLWFVIWLSFSNNIQTPAGYVGYITQGSAFGQSKYVGLQTGPTSSGKSWLYHGNNISITPYTEDELWKTGGDIILAQDKLPLLVDAHIIWRIKSDENNVKVFMEQYGGLSKIDSDKEDQVEKEAYRNYIRSPFRNIVRDELSKYPGLEVNEHLQDASKDILKACKEKFDNTPFEVISTVIGNCAPPEAVTQEIARKVAATQELKRKEIELDIAKKKEDIQRAEGRAAAAMELETAKGKSAAIEEIKKQLSPEYLTYEAIRGFNGAQRIYIPTGNGGIPLVGNLFQDNYPDEPSTNGLLPQNPPPAVK